MNPVRGTLRAGKRTKELVARLRPGDIALINHRDLDPTAARALLDCRPVAVINAAPSISGRYPNRGPGLLYEAGVPLLDAVGEEFFTAALAFDGQSATLAGNDLAITGGPTGTGTIMDAERLSKLLVQARQNVAAELNAFATNTLEHLSAETPLLLDPIELPDIRCQMKGRHVLIVVRGEGFREDLLYIEAYLRDVRPVLIGVDGGADALLEVGMRPDVILGDMDSVSDRALRCGAELVVHGYATGSRAAPGMKRVTELGLEATVFHIPGTSEDAAMLLADEKGASLIVAVGTHFSLEEFLDKGRAGMASTFLVRLRMGSKLVDAKGLGRLWQKKSPPAWKEAIILTLAALFPVAVIALNSPFLRAALSAVRLWVRSTLGLR